MTPYGWLILVALATAAFTCSARASLRPFAFPAWVLVAVGTSMVQPDVFGTWFGVDLKIFIVPLIQVITFGMGTTLSLVDFTRVLRMPWPVLIGFLLQFTLMPGIGWVIATGLGFEPEVAAGIILVGSVSGGVASNLVTYLAGGDVALSVTMTACSTFASPFLTPVLMKVLAGKLVPIDMIAMMFDILSMILVPVIAGLVAHRILYGRDRFLQSAQTLVGLTLAGFLVGIVCFLAPWPSTPAFVALRNGFSIAAALIGLVTGAKVVMTHGFRHEGPWMDRALSLVSMLGICVIIGIITARSREKLLSVGFLLFLAAVAHNTIGYLLGYWGARAASLDERTCRTVAIEVGMQNAGMASGLAMSVLQSAHAALAPAIFGPWMNLSGSLLASWWQRRPPSDSAPQPPPQPSTPPSP